MMDSYQLNFFYDMQTLASDFAYSDIFGAMSTSADGVIIWTFTVPDHGNVIMVKYMPLAGGGVEVVSSNVDAIEDFIKTEYFEMLKELVTEEWETEMSVAVISNETIQDIVADYTWQGDRVVESKKGSSNEA